MIGVHAKRRHIACTRALWFTRINIQYIHDHQFRIARPAGNDRRSGRGGGVADLEDVAGLDDDVVHMDELEAAEVPWHGDEVHGGALVELEEAGVVQVLLPPELTETPLQHLVRAHHLAAGHVHKHLARPRPAGAAADVARRVAVGAPHHTVLEHPHPRHGSFLATGAVQELVVRGAGRLGRVYIQGRGRWETLT